MNEPTHRHCTCMSGLTETQVKFLELAGALSVVEWLTIETKNAHAGPVPIGDPELFAQLERAHLLIVQLIAFCRQHGWKRGES